MKIRTKIILISSSAVLISLLMMSGVIFQIVQRSRKNEVYMKAEQNSSTIAAEVEKWMKRVDDADTNEILLDYFFKKYTDENGYNICVQETATPDGEMIEKEIWNPTVFPIEKLLDLKSEGSSGTFSYENKEYLVFSHTYENGIIFLRLEDITYVQREMRNLLIVLIFSVVVIVILTVVALHIILHRVFLPLQQLSDSAKQIAEGVYSKRVKIQQADEIGQLSKSFNQMAEAVELHTHQLEESEMRKTLFMGNLTHELKTPMTAISGYAQMLLTLKLNEKDQEEALGYIYSECGRLERLSKKMMRLLELESDFSFPCEDVAAVDLFQAVRKSCEILGEEKQIKFIFREHGEHFCLDADLMQNALLNLIDNGIKASEMGSCIIVSADENCISVEDFGKGIPKEEQEHIFEPFYMVDKSRSRKTGGAGLGLTLTAQIAKLHHAEIQVDSKVGKGTKVSLQFVYNAMNT